MPDNNIANQNGATAAPLQQSQVSSNPTPVSSVLPAAQPALADSPWSEPLPEAAPNKPQVSGTLAPSQPAAASPAVSSPVPAQPFTLPQNVEGSMPPVLKATDLVSPAKVLDNIKPAPTLAAGAPTSVSGQIVGVDSVSKANSAFNFNYNQSNVASAPAAASATASKPLDAISTQPGVTAAQQPAKPAGIASLIAKPSASAPSTPPQVATPPVAIQPPVQAPVSGPAVQTTQPPQPLSQPQPVIVPPIQPVVAMPSPQPLAPASPQPPVPNQQGRTFVVPENVSDAQPGPVAQPPAAPAQKSGLSKLFAGLKRQPKAENQLADSLVPPETVSAGSRFKSKTAIVFYVLLIILVVVSGLIYLTEAGVLSIGLEKVYGTVGLEKIWGGLPSDSETALAKSFLTMKDHQQFKVSGTIALNIDKTIKNTITTPLVSENETIDRIAVLPIKAILADVTTSTDPAATDPNATGSSSSTDTTSTSTDTTGSTSTTDTSTATPADQSAELTYTDTTTTKAINTTITGSFGNAGNDVEIKVVKPIGSQTIELKNQQGSLWVKSDQISFNDKAEAGKWLLYNLASLGTTGFVSQTLAVDSAKGFSAEGTRQANEKVGLVRCYKYALNNVELGSSLAGIGVSSDSIQNITGTVWIGVKDKLIRRIDLKVTTSPSSPIIQINLSLNFSDYDSNNSFTAPDSAETIEPANSTTSTATSSVSTTPASSTTQAGE